MKKISQATLPCVDASLMVLPFGANAGMIGTVESIVSSGALDSY